MGKKKKAKLQSRECFKKMFYESEKGCCECRDESSYSAYIEDIKKEETDSEGMYHKKNSKLTKKIQKLTQYYPSLPIVIPSGLGVNNEELDCSIAYVYSNGKFTEKILLVHHINKSFSINVSDIYLDLPFH